MANILLQLFSLKLRRTSSLVEERGENSVRVGGRPSTANMKDTVIHPNIPANILPSQTYDSTSEWYRALGDMHMAQLAFQHNNAVEDEDDAREKYVTRQLFRRSLLRGPLQLGCGTR